ncbi:hypothetical protein LCGC14_1498160 [marine sediment metagenome]|uniref:Uncharacterized protein n=1 Tax=marine sediment metagenome TaxID=412755 RepID=A0A0F9JQU1_9ZZZZ
MNNEAPIYYVTSKGSVKGPRGLLVPGDVYPMEGVSPEKLESMLKNGNLHTDLAEAFNVQEPITQPPLPMNDSGTDNETPPLARSMQKNDAAQRQALREAKLANQEPVEVLGAGPVRVENKALVPVTETDPSNVTLEDLAGQNISVEEFNSLKN